MSKLNPAKLNVTYMDGTLKDGPVIPRVYTLTHSDFTGDLFLTIGMRVNKTQVLGLYTRFMRDEIWAEWINDNTYSLLVHSHVSGGFVFGTASWRYSILKHHMLMVLQSFRFGDRYLFNSYPELNDAQINVQFHSNKKQFDKLVSWKSFKEYQI